MVCLFHGGYSFSCCPDSISQKPKVDHCRLIPVALWDLGCSGCILCHPNLKALLQQFPQVRFYA
nr:hypothetical protein [uncultured bacterium]